MPFPALKSRPTAAGVVFLPAERFFWRVVPLDPAQDAAPQAELAVESLGPFPTAQLYWGFLASPARDQAVIYAAHRRRFSAEEAAGWHDAELVVPDLLALCARPGPGPSVVIRADDRRLAGVAWAAAGELPAALLAREFPAAPTDAERQAFAAELAGRAGVAGVAPRFVAGDPSAERAGESLALRLTAAGGAVVAAVEFAEAAVDALDARDRTVLAELRTARSRGLLFWRICLGGAALAALALAFELMAGGIRVYNRGLQADIAARRPEVQRLEAANTLAARIDELANQQLRPFELLVFVNEKRPASVQFQRVVARDRATLEIEAQSRSSGDIDAFVAAIRGLPGVARFEPRPQQSRDGLISISLTIVFEPSALRPREGAS